MADDLGERQTNSREGKDTPSEQDEPSLRNSMSLNRRHVLQASALTALSGLAGCSAICPDDFEAAPAILPNPPGFGLQDSKPQRVQITKNVLGKRRLINYSAIYGASEDGAIGPVGVYSTPLVTCLGQDLNPIATQGFETLLKSPQLGAEFVTMVVPQATSTNWEQGPVPHETWSGTLFSESVTVNAYTGIVGEPDETLHAILIAITRHRNKSQAVLVGSGTAKRLAEDVSPSDIDVIPGVFSQAEVSTVKQLLLSVLPTIRKVNAPAPQQSTTGYGMGGYGQGGYGGTSA